MFDPREADPVNPVGRRPGKLSAREDIIRAARATFATGGYDGTSLRAVARAAGVDAALIHHYFEGKPGLFMAAMALPLGPRQVQLDVSAAASGSSTVGAAVVEGFLTMWDRAEGSGSSFVTCAGAMAASPTVAHAMREFIGAWVRPHMAPVDGEAKKASDTRGALVVSQLMGLAYSRYVLRVPPISTATPSEIGGWVGPTLEWYRTDPLGEFPRNR